MAASTAVLTMSCTPSWATRLSSVPPPVPMPSWALVIFIAFPFLVAHAAFHRLQHPQGQGQVPGHDHHLGRQLHRRGDNQLAGHRQRFLNPVVKCRFPHLGNLDCFCFCFHCLLFSYFPDALRFRDATSFHLLFLYLSPCFTSVA